MHIKRVNQARPENYVYKVTAPERATVGVTKRSQDYFQLDQIKLRLYWEAI